MNVEFVVAEALILLKESKICKKNKKETKETKEPKEFLPKITNKQILNTKKRNQFACSKHKQQHKKCKIDCKNRIQQYIDIIYQYETE